MSDRLKEIVEQVNATFAENNMEKFLSFCADDIQWTMVGHKSVKGKDAIRQWMKSMGDMEPPKITVDSRIAEGDSVVAQGNVTMQDKDGKTAPHAFCDIYRFRDEKIVELIAFVIKTESKSEAGSGA